MSDTLTSISPLDKRSQRQVDALLEQEGIQRDGNLDYTCGIFDDGLHLAATGSCFANTIRCLAVDGSRRGEGLLGQVVGHLLEVQVQRGNGHVFLYTKPEAARFFSDLGFYEIARVEDKLVFMENRRTGFSGYCGELEQWRQEGDAAAVVMNANPFTLGHLHLVEQAAAENRCVHLFVLSEEAGPIPFAVRRKLVRDGTAQLDNVICHDSGPYIISSATFPSYFLKDGDTVIRTQAALDLRVFQAIAGRLNIRRRYVGEEPSSRVTGLYNEVMARRLPEVGIECRIIPRLEKDGRAISASSVRQAIHDGEMDKALALLPDTGRRYFSGPEAEKVIKAIQAEKNVVHY